MSPEMMDEKDARIRELEQEVADLKRGMAKLSEEHHLLVIDGELECSLKTFDEAKERAKELALLGRRGEVLVIEVHGGGAFYKLGPIEKF
jgi:hypothetical protein